MKPSFSQLANCAKCKPYKRDDFENFPNLKRKGWKAIGAGEIPFFLNSLFKWSTCFCPCKEDEKSVTSHEPKFLEGVLNEV